MKKTLIVCSILAAIAIVIGIVLIIVGGTFGFGGAVNYTDESFTSQGSVTRLEIDVAAGTAKVQFYDGDSVQVDYQTHSKYGFTVSESGGTVKLEQVRTGWWINWGINMRKAPTATVRIPRALILDLDIDISAGLVEVGSGTFGKVTCEISAGKLALGEIVCTALESDVSAGTFEISGLTCEFINCDISAGNATINRVNCDRIDIDVSAGNISMKVLGNKSDYTILVDKSAGNCNVTSQTGTEPNKRITVDVSAGNVSVNFI